jgi:hypothetical protein
MAEEDRDIWSTRFAEELSRRGWVLLQHDPESAPARARGAMLVVRSGTTVPPRRWEIIIGSA